MSAPYGSSELADGIKEGFEEGREFQKFFLTEAPGC